MMKVDFQDELYLANKIKMKILITKKMNLSYSFTMTLSFMSNKKKTIKKKFSSVIPTEIFDYHL